MLQLQNAILKHGRKVEQKKSTHDALVSEDLNIRFVVLFVDDSSSSS